MIRPFHFAPNFEFDEWKTITLTRKQTNAFKQKKADDPARYRCLPNSSPFDFIDLHDNKYSPLKIGSGKDFGFSRIPESKETSHGKL